MSRVSVIIPTKNRAQYIEGALASVLSQTFDDLDILVVDDASTDNTEQVVKSFRDSRIHYIRHPESRGGSATRNTGIRSTEAPLIAFLDDDDEWLPEKLELQLKVLDTSHDKVGCVYTGFDRFDKDFAKKLSVKVPKYRGDLRSVLLLGNAVGTTSTVLLRRSYLAQAGLFDEELHSMQDYDMWLRLAQFCEFEYIEAPLVRYRVHGTCISSSLEGLEQGLRQLLKKHGSPDRLKRTCSRLLLDVGVQYAESGKMREAWRALATTVRLNPTDPAGYFYLASASLGQGGYSGMQTLKRKILTAFQSSHPRGEQESA